MGSKKITPWTGGTRFALFVLVGKSVRYNIFQTPSNYARALVKLYAHIIMWPLFIYFDALYSAVL